MKNSMKTGKKGVSLVLAVLMVLGILMPASAFAASHSDIDGHWAEGVITLWVEANLAGGYDDGTFRPDKPVTRAEFMAFTNRAFKFSAETMIRFSDVPAGAWYVGVVKQAVAAGYIAGYPDGTMGPDNPITRQEAAVIISKVAFLSGNTMEADGFSDKASIPAWSKPFVGAVAKAGLMVGYPDSSFKPANNITRAEAVAALNNAKSFQTNIYSAAGTYGPETGSQTLSGNVVVLVKDVTLRNITIKGDLILAEGIGEGDVTLNNVTVEGSTYVRGGGVNSIHINGGSYNNVIVEKVNGKVRIVATDAEGIKVVLATQADDSNEIILEGSFDSITISAPGVNLTLQGTTTVKELTIESTAIGSTVHSTSSVTIDNAVIQTKTTFTGQGTITEASGSSASESTYENPPENVEEPVAPPVGGGGGGGGTLPALTVSNITVQHDGLGSLADNDDTVRVTGIEFTVNDSGSTLTINQIVPESGLAISYSYSKTFTGTTATVSFEELLNKSSISLGDLRGFFGSELTIKGTLSKSGYTSYTEDLVIELGGTGSEIYTNDWAEVHPDGNTLVATILPGQEVVTLNSIGISVFLEDTFEQIPSEVRIGSNAWITVPGNEGAIATQIGAFGGGWSTVTIGDLVGETIQFKKTGSDTIYTLSVVMP